MDKCEHGERIELFCATDSCVWREGAGCQLCFQKYHNHLGQSVFVQERDIEPLLKKYQSDPWLKPKVKKLEQTIHTYFSTIREQFHTFTEGIDRNLRTALCYPYLSNHSTVEVYKKLRKREYTKLHQREFRTFYEQTLSLTPQQFARQQKELYQKQLLKARKILLGIFQAFSQLEKELKVLHHGTTVFKTDKVSEQKIKFIFDSLGSAKKQQELKTPSETIDRSEKRVTMEKEKSDKTSPRANQRRKSFAITSNLINLHSTSLQKDTRKKEFNQDKDDLSQRKRQVANLPDHPRKEENTFNYVITIPDSEPPTMFSQPSSRQNIEAANLQIPDKKAKKDALLITINPILAASSSIQSITSSNDKFGNKLVQKAGNQISEFKHNQLPSQASNLGLEDKSFKQTDNLRLIVVPFKGDKNIQPSQSSPLHQKRKKMFETFPPLKEQAGFELTPILELSPVIEQPGSPPKPKTTSEQEKSIELLTKAIQSKCEDAISLLQSALLLAPHNLSAAEYLSYLLLETSNAKECLKVCNSIHQQLQNQIIYELNLLHINNNRAVALLMLGRYSEAIVALEKCLTVQDDPLTYKNLGDAYYSIGIYEKAVYNYEKGISLKPSGEAYYNLAVCLFMQRNFHNSLNMAELALRCYPDISEYSALVKEIKSNL